VEKHIQNTLLKCATFQLEKAPKIYTGKKVERGVHYYEKNSKPVIYHLIMANDISEAGEEYNPYTIKYIQDSIQYLTDLTSFDIIETLKERFITLSKDYFENPISKSELMDNKSIFQNKRLSIQKCNKGKIDLQLKCCLIDELGFSNLKGNGFEPNYNYYIKDDQIIVRVEAPGNSTIESNLEYIGEYTTIKLKGTKNKDKEPKEIEQNIFNSREIGNFSLDIPLKTEEYLIKNELPKIEKKNGIFIIYFKLEEKQSKVKRYNSNKEDEI
jgi:HSP20 family molecular chaperone IbpA